MLTMIDAFTAYVEGIGLVDIDQMAFDLRDEYPEGITAEILQQYAEEYKI